jgi:DNA modification methylase
MPQAQLSNAQLNRIHHGDCIAGMNGLPAGSVDLVFADPPFNIGYDYDVYHDAKDYEEYLAWSRQWIGAVHRVLKPDGAFWLAIGDEYAAELKLESQKLGFHIRSWVIWYYTFGVNCKSKFSRSHAHLFYFVKDKTRFTFRSEELENRIPSARLLVYGDNRSNPQGRLPDDTWILRPQDLADCFSTAEDTWYVPRVAGTFKERQGFHGCQMPEQLLGRIIRICSHPGQVVLDPFSGSATTLAVAKKLGRQFLGFDLSPDYVQHGADRLAAICVGDALDGSAEPTMSAPVTPGPRGRVHSQKPGRVHAQKPGRVHAQKQSPLEQILESSAAAQPERQRALFESGLVEAFATVHDGHSLDRVVADPDLNQRLADECTRLGLPGDIHWWNRGLFRARKAGRLAHLTTTRATDLSWQQCDPFLFACEIAWKKMSELGFESLDDILCDPAAASAYDRQAAQYAPGFTSLEYRWGALKLRKESKRARARAGLLGRAKLHFLTTLPAKTRSFGRIPETAGVYLVSAAGGEPLYAGEALCLRSRLVRQFDRALLKIWDASAQDLQIQFFEATADATLLLAYQALCVRQHRPRLNLPVRDLV